jgi:hypothetical protein
LTVIFLDLAVVRPKERRTTLMSALSTEKRRPARSAKMENTNTVVCWMTVQFSRSAESARRPGTRAVGLSKLNSMRRRLILVAIANIQIRSTSSDTDQPKAPERYCSREPIDALHSWSSLERR